MVMTKKDFVEYVANNHGLTKKDAKEMIDSVTCCILSAMAEGNDINLVGFGKFSVVDVEERERRNPITGETFMAEAHRVPKFKFASNVKADLR